MTCKPRSAPAAVLVLVLAAFARLGMGCFGGPVAHIVYFRAEFVERGRVRGAAIA